MAWMRGAIVGAILSLGAVAWAIDVPAAMRLPSIWGDVVFPHARHFEHQRCATCHGEGRKAGRIDAIHERMEPAHGFCLGCHREQIGIEGEPDCSVCHLPRHGDGEPLRGGTASAG
jgi:c(7)-type cytochrome triheme protein